MDHPMLAVEDPATGQRITNVPDAGPDDVDKAVRAAARAWPAWRTTDRHAALASCAVVVDEAAAVLAPVLTEEQGKPLREAKAEFARAAARFRHFARLRLEPQVVGDGRVEVHRRPLGPVAAITPWNFPVQLAVAKLAPAFAAGNTVVLKPSPRTPLTTLHLGRMLTEVLPPGVLTVLTGQDPLGERLVAHPGIKKVDFTGSVPTGKHVAAAAAPGLKRLALELGGNDPAIVLPDTDPADIAERLFWSAFANCGQNRMAVKRVYAVGPAYDGIVEALAAFAETVVVGDGRAPGTQLGPVNNKPRYDRVIELTEEARAAGARIVTGGRLDGPGYFFAPAILAEAHDGMRVVREEQAGPVLPIVRCSTVDEAVELANATTSGLCGSVWGADEERAAEVAMRLECGTVRVNEHMARTLDEPFAGSQWSGLGGSWGVDEDTEPFVVHRRRG
ncbi:aldehyde dehydrogenase family protein [Amycolatopsis umgeniensis]|uniref:Acyl-CoA reductase-like NAD-dependent aldehyde dehydrogenase n=1 Tax=Amycolatopsis umgeniensis TaxID=336628 RepID=A0A841BBH2_9PSEU|nr:aldehyde dehydrogenase family protein [Amycolatopsis umgeniensis]MBB5856251.1 acyl-CoA reductase-like NAD-dependent aldehyde dehydrogenase [Amycolatopsis umgeniensis]